MLHESPGIGEASGKVLPLLYQHLTQRLHNLHSVVLQGSHDRSRDLHMTSIVKMTHLHGVV